MPKKVEAQAKLGQSKDESTSGETQEEVCFVIMPFGGWFDTYYQDVFCPAIVDAELQPRRADDIYRTGSIVHDIWDLTKMADVILADLTGKNPNVLYELGLAHALAKPAIMVTETFDDIPFDLRALRIIEYDRNDPAWGGLLKEKITKSIEEVLKDPQKAVPPAFLDVEKTSKTTKVSPLEKEILEIRNDLSILRREVRTSNIGRPSVSPSARSRPHKEEALAIIEDLLAKGMPTEGIMERMRLYGAPTGWTLETIEELQTPHKRSE